MQLHCFLVTGAKVRTFQKPTKSLPRFFRRRGDFFVISPREFGVRWGVRVGIGVSRAGRGRVCTPFLAHRPTGRRSGWR